MSTAPPTWADLAEFLAEFRAHVADILGEAAEDTGGAEDAEDRIADQEGPP